MDVKLAYLHSAIEEQSFAKHEENWRNLACELNKSIYGLKQAAKNLYESLANLLIGKGFQRSCNDYCLSVRKEENAIFSYILLWVDDIIIAAERDFVDTIKSLLEKNFNMDDRGELHWFLVMHIIKSEGKITVDREKYIENLLKQFDMNDYKHKVRIPSVHVKTNKTGYSQYSQSVIKILWEPRHNELESSKTRVKICQRHNYSTINFWQEFQNNLIDDTDADWSSDLGDRKSTTGYYFNFKENSYKLGSDKESYKISEAEYQAMGAAVQEAIYLRALMKDFGFPMKDPTYIGKDNQSFIKMFHNSVMHKRSKHIDAKFHFVGEKVKSKEVAIHYTHTESMTADILTKSLPRIKVEKHRYVLIVN